MSAFESAIESQITLPKAAPIKVYDHEVDLSKYSNKLIPRYSLHLSENHRIAW